MDRGVLASGTLVGSYVIERELADGGMGTIYEATHRILRRRVALKVLHRHLLEHCAAAERLTQEARILEDVQHSGVVGVHDAGYLADGRPWLAMELLTGITLAQRLERARRLDVREVVTILRSLVETLGVAHARGVVHRDLKPDNIIVVKGGNGSQVKLIDW